MVGAGARWLPGGPRAAPTCEGALTGLRGREGPADPPSLQAAAPHDTRRRFTAAAAATALYGSATRARRAERDELLRRVSWLLRVPGAAQVPAPRPPPALTPPATPGLAPLVPPAARTASRLPPGARPCRAWLGSPPGPFPPAPCCPAGPVPVPRCSPAPGCSGPGCVLAPRSRRPRDPLFGGTAWDDEDDEEDDGPSLAQPPQDFAFGFGFGPGGSRGAFEELFRDVGELLGVFGGAWAGPPQPFGGEGKGLGLRGARGGAMRSPAGGPA